MKNINPSFEIRIITTFLKAVIKTTGRKNVVIGWSGGIDSTVCLYLLTKAVPKKQIYILHMPYSMSAVNELKGLSVKGLNIHEINIKKSVEEIWKTVKGDYSLDSRLRGNDERNSLKKIRLGNIMARVRMITLFDYAKKINGLVCGTENRTERLLGYYTRYGDGASDIEPIQHLYKTQVYQLAQYLNIPEIFINKSPSANLWKGQTDEGEFGFSYKEADEVLYRFIDKSKSVAQIEKEGFQKAKKVIEFMRKNEFKRKVPYIL